ncbi:MAG: RNA polymerase sigma factor [Pirellulaceae bacterium]
MKSDEEQLSTLLARLGRGDLAAAEQIFLKYEPYLHMVVRRQISGRLHAKFNASDIVQSVWADLLAGFRNGRWHFSDTGHLRAFLVKATQNRFLDRVRQQRISLCKERSLTQLDMESMTPTYAARPSQHVRLGELWQAMLDSLPEQHRVLLEMKRHGKSLVEIAAATGYHESSVRRILYDLARQFVSHRRRELKRSRADSIGPDPTPFSPSAD